MKIGIITWFTGPNYGTNLQAIALQYYLRNQGYEVNIINYEVSSPKMVKERKSLIRRIAYQPKKYAVKYALKKYQKEIAIRDQKLSRAINENCILTFKIKDINELITTCNKFDLLICGSDQIWNPNWYDRFYYADYDQIRTRRISYAPSIGVNKIPDNKISEIKRSLNKFSCISVRESKALKLLNACTDKKLEVVVDPTLLLTNEDWNHIFEDKNSKKQKYVFAFFLNDERAHLRATKNFAKKHHCKLIMIPYKGITYLQKADIRADAGLEDLLSLIRNAEFILTDSFHITVFSIIFKKQFYTFQRFKENAFTSQNIRITNLLDIVDMKNRMVKYQSLKIDEVQMINYETQTKKLNNEIEKSKQFLDNAIRNNRS